MGAVQQRVGQPNERLGSRHTTTTKPPSPCSGAPTGGRRIPTRRWGACSQPNEQELKYKNEHNRSKGRDIMYNIRVISLIDNRINEIMGSPWDPNLDLNNIWTRSLDHHGMGSRSEIDFDFGRMRSPWFGIHTNQIRDLNWMEIRHYARKWTRIRTTDWDKDDKLKIEDLISPRWPGQTGGDDQCGAALDRTTTNGHRPALINTVILFN